MSLVDAGDLTAAEQVIADALDAGHLWRVSLLIAPKLEPLHGRPRFESLAADARRRVEVRHLEPLVLTAKPDVSGVSPLVLVLHGATGNAAEELERWRPATEHGWIVAAGQSSQPATAEGFCWDPPRARIWEDLRVIASRLPPHGRVVIGGFSQGAWIALNAALQADLIVAGSVVMVAPFAGPAGNLPPPWRRLKVSIVVGEHDTHRSSVEGLAQRLTEQEHHVSLEVVPGLGHAYPADFTVRLRKLLRP